MIAVRDRPDPIDEAPGLGLADVGEHHDRGHEERVERREPDEQGPSYRHRAFIRWIPDWISLP